MAANLTAIFSLVDNVSSKLDAMADSGSAAVEQWESAGAAANDAFDAASRGGQQVATACSQVASAAGSMGDALDQSSDSADSLEDMFVICEQAAGALVDSIDAAVGIHEELTAAIEEAGGASEEAAEALEQLEAAQREAEEAMENYDAVMISGTNDLGELEAAAERAMHAAENLAEANARASEATEELGRESDNAGDKMEDTGQKGVDAFEAIGNTLIGAAIAKTLKEAAEAAYELTDAFSDAESTIVLATGASGEALEGLSASMTRVYAASKTGSLDDTASAIGEINTRLGYTGQQLEDTTSLFLDFTAVTGGQVAGNVRNVTQLMRQWNVSTDDLESTLDKLTYAGQASGISVDNLSSQLTSNKAILDELGFSLDESIAMFSQFELNGTQAASVMTGFRTAINNGTISSLEDLYDIFEQIASGEISAAEAGDIFGGRAGTTIVNAVKNGTFALDGFVTALENTQGATVATAESAQTLSQQWEQASNNISSAFTTAIEPVASKLSSGLASVANDVGTFLNEHPTVTKAITAVGVGIGVAAAAISGFVVVTKVAIPGLTAFGTALNTALGPIGWVALGITAVVAAGTALVAMLKDNQSEYDTWTNTTRQQYDALQDLNAEYENAVATYGETSEQALRLRNEMEDLEAEFEANKQTVEQFVAACDELVQKHGELVSSYNDGMTSIHEEEVGTLALIQRLEDLATGTDQGVASQEKMQAIIDTLNEKYPNLGLSIDSVTESTDSMVASLHAAAEAQAEYEMQQERRQTYVDLLKEQALLEEQIAVAEANLNAELERTGYYWDDVAQQYTNGSVYEEGLWSIWTTDVKTYHDALDELNATYAGNQALMAEIEEAWNDQAEAIEDTEEATISYEQAAAMAFQSVQEEIEELCQAYDDAYQAAITSFEGQFGLFDQATTESETYMNATVENAQAALESQLAYWDSYLANVQVLKDTSAEDLGITQENYDLLMSYVQDGSEEAAGLAASMVEAIQSGDEEAVADLANTAGEVAARQQEIASTMAEWQTNFNATMDELVAKMDSAVDDLNLDTEAAAAAKSTIDSYANQIRTSGASAVAAAQSIAAQVSAALSSANATISVGTSVSGHAQGTTNAEDVFVAGEEGPELILGMGGATVFPAEETERIISAVSEYNNAWDNASEAVVNYGDTVYNTYETANAERDAGAVIYALPGRTEDGADVRELASDGGTRKIVLSLEGKGNIEIGGGSGANTEQVVAVLYEYLKPVLTEILTEEIFEEGDYSYEY